MNSDKRDEHAPHPLEGPRDQTLPESSLWPAAVAAGIALAFFGVASSVVFVVVGLLLAGIAIGGWIGEMVRD